MEGRDSMSSSDPWLGRVRKRVVPICDTCVEQTQTDGGAVSLLSSAGVRAVVYATNDASTTLEMMQIDLAEGPCVDAGAGPSPVLINDLQDPREGVVERWPFFLPQVDALGIRSVFAFPVHIGSVVLGTLELHRTRAGRLEPRQVTTALQAADQVAAAILDVVGADDGGRAETASADGVSLGDGSVDGGPLDAGMLGRSAASVHQAAGMVMVQSGSTIDEAMAQLRASAFAEGVSLISLSAEVISGRRRFRKEQL
jgi:hypothetical protein